MDDVYTLLDFKLIVTADDSLGDFRIPYLVFNSLEAVVWFGCAGFIWFRWWRRGTLSREWCYALAFAAFSLSDVIETFGTTPLLLMFKGACLLALFAFRDQARKVYGSRYL